MNKSFVFITLIAPALSIGCGGESDTACTASNYCALTESGAAECDTGYTWVAPDAAGDYRCSEILQRYVPVLGNGGHSVDFVSITTVGTSADGLKGPRDLAFHPTVSGQLWVVNRDDESVTIFSDLGTTGQSSRRVWNPEGAHFLAQPAALAFSDNGNFATIHETSQETQGPVSSGGTPSDFMGPTLWSSDQSTFNGGHSGHLDMMHNSPLGMGIAWERDNAFWIFDGYHASITRYDFRQDHGPGGTWHDDGTVERYVEGEIRREANVPSHMEIDHARNHLYIADTGNNRIARLDTTSGFRLESLPVSEIYDCTQSGCSEYFRMSDANVSTFVDGAALGLQKPSGLAYDALNRIVFVSDFATGSIYAFDDGGELMDQLNLGRQNAIMGIELGAEGRLYVVDNKANEILRIEAK